SKGGILVNGRLARRLRSLALAAAATPWLVVGSFSGAVGIGAVAALPVPHPVVSEYVQMSTSTTPPTQAQCFSAGRRCFSPQAIRASYNLLPLYSAGFDGTGRTIAVVDSYGSDTMAHDLHV